MHQLRGQVQELQEQVQELTSHLQRARERITELESNRYRRTVQVLESFEHGIDHPTLLSMNESRYLKALFVRG